MPFGIGKPRAPVDGLERVWIEEMLAWCAAEFGPRTLRTPVILPTADFFPDEYSGTQAEIRAIVERVRQYMGVGDDRITVEFHGADDSELAALPFIASSFKGDAGHYRLYDGRAVVSIDVRQARSPQALVATIAHELAHERLLGEGRIGRDRHDGEQLTDLLTVYLGLGVFNANAAFQFTQGRGGWRYNRLGYLPQPMFGYALACWTAMRGDPDPAWAGHLDTNPRGYMKQALRYLRANPESASAVTSLIQP